jgi:hypothetical protein
LQKPNLKIYSDKKCVVLGNIKGRTKTEDVQEQGVGGIFGSRIDEVVGGWRKLHNEELHNLYTS